MIKPVSVTIDLSTWTRLDEVLAFADRRGCSLEEAIRLTVNTGLSHFQRENLLW